MTDENAAEKPSDNTAETTPENVAANTGEQILVENFGNLKASDALGNEIGHCLFYLQMPEDVFQYMMAAPLTTHARIMSDATNGGAGGKGAVLMRAVRLMTLYERACMQDDPHGAQARLNKKFSELKPYLPKPPSGPPSV